MPATWNEAERVAKHNDETRRLLAAAKEEHGYLACYLGGSSLIGKRVGLPEGAATVVKASGGLCVVKYDRWVTTGLVLQSVIAELPVLHARATFDYAAASAAYYINERRAALNSTTDKRTPADAGDVRFETGVETDVCEETPYWVETIDDTGAVIDRNFFATSEEVGSFIGSFRECQETTLKERLAPFGLEWQREQDERWGWAS